MNAVTDTPPLTAAPTSVSGVIVIESKVFPDDRGTFMTAYGARELQKLGLELAPAEVHLVHNQRAHTLRGLHFQTGPSAQVKIVRCIRGAVYDVALDLRQNSPTYLQWTGVELRPGDGRALYIPVGCAHGYLTIEDDTNILYLVGTAYDPARAGGVRWNDPAFGIAWPAEPQIIADRDASYPDYEPVDWSA
jgi:dTDP-4-dehydrorhamnose 3,5-epimerase